MRLPPPLSPATTIRVGSMPKSAACPATQRKPDTQSFRPAGKGATSGDEEAATQLRKSTMTTTTPLAAMCLPQPRYIPSKQDMVAMPPPWM